MAKHYGPDRAKNKWKTLVQARDSIHGDMQRIAKIYAELNKLSRTCQRQYQKQAKGMASQGNNMEDAANSVARKLRTERDKYSKCEKLLRQLGAKPQDIYANWSGGKKDYDQYVKNNFPKEMNKVKTAGW